MSSSSPPESKPRTRRDEILDEATRLFSERGYEGASMADLAERVGLRKASLFHHFTSKEVLYAVVVDRVLEPITAAILKAVLTEGSFAERLDAMTDAITLALADQPFAARLLLREVMDWGPISKATLAAKIQVALDGAYQFARAGQAAGAFVGIDAKHAIISIIGVHFFAFAGVAVVDGFVGQNPFTPAFVEERRTAVRDQIRLMVVKTSA